MITRFFKSPPPVGTADVTAFEQEIGAKLPGDYVEFLLRVNGGTAVPGTFRSQLDHEMYFAEDFYGLEPGNANAGLSLNFQTQLGWDWPYPEKLLPVAGDGCGNGLAISLRAEDFGCIYWLEHEEDAEDRKNLKPAFASFSDLLASGCINPVEGEFPSLLDEQDFAAIERFIAGLADINAPVNELGQNILDVIFDSPQYRGFQHPELVAKIVSLGGKSHGFRPGHEYDLRISKLMLEELGMKLENSDALLQAARRWDAGEIVSYYLEHGAALTQRDVMGMNALEIARQALEFMQAEETAPEKIQAQEQIIAELEEAFRQAGLDIVPSESPLDNSLEIRLMAFEKIPLELLLEADPSESKVKGYLPRCDCYAALIQDQIVGTCLLLPLRAGVSEIINIAVSPDHQNLGIGKRLLHHVIEDARSRGLHKLELGTGTFGYQLSFYQKAGFRAESVDRDFFLKNYDEPLFEDGIQHKDMLRLGMNLNDYF